jgi:hypothetical protein
LELTFPVAEDIEADKEAVYGDFAVAQSYRSEGPMVWTAGIYARAARLAIIMVSSCIKIQVAKPQREASWRNPLPCPK